MASGVLDEVRLRLKCHTAHLTLVRKAALVSLDMNFFIFLSSERHSTDLTFEGFFSSMASIMYCQRGLLLKSLWALVTLKGIFFEMLIDMVFHLHMVSISLIAVRHRTCKRSFRVMNKLYVFVKASPFSEVLFAIWTHLWHNIAMKS